MRLHRRVLGRRLALLAAVAALALIATEQASAQFGGRSGFNRRATFSAAPQAGKMSRENVAPRMQKTNAVSRSRNVAGVRAGSKVSGYPKVSSDGRGDTVRPPRPGRPDPTGPRGPGRDPRPGWGIGPGIATGVIIGTAAAAAADQPPPSFVGPLGPRGGINIPPPNEQRFVPNEVVLEFAGNFPPQAMTALARRHRLARLESQGFALTNSIYFRARIIDGRPVRSVLNALRGEAALRSGQPNYLYRFAQQQSGADVSAPPAPAPFAPPQAATPAATPVVASAAALPAAGDPAQYTLAKLRLQEAHGLAKGNNVLVAVIDSGVDAGHPELKGVIAGTFDALGTAEKPHAHGTAIAGAIAARARLMGVAPAARILAIRAFGTTNAGAEATSFAILKSIDYAAIQNARVINMSFAGPADPGLARSYAAARARGIVLVAAAGNLGATAPPQYPAADPNVIAVTATDAEDKLFAASNRGHHIAIAAPGVDILLPAPDANYQVASGTSFAAAHVSGIVALILERKPGLDPELVRAILQATAKDLGPSGKDEQFGAGLADAYQAILALEPRTASGPAPSPQPAAAAR